MVACRYEYESIENHESNTRNEKKTWMTDLSNRLAS